MDDLISRQAVIDAFDCSVGGVPVESVKYVSEYADKMMSRINALSSVQSKQKIGKWIKGRGLYKCSCCNKSWTAWWAGAVPIEQMKKEMPYCPMCGSYNGEETENETN